MSTILPHMVWPFLVQIENAGLKCAARGTLEIQDPKIDICAPSHIFVRPYLRNEGKYRQSEKKLVKQRHVVYMS